MTFINTNINTIVYIPRHVCVVFSQISLIAAGDVRAHASVRVAGRGRAPKGGRTSVGHGTYPKNTCNVLHGRGKVRLYLLGTTVPSPGLYACVCVCTYNERKTPTAKRLRRFGGRRNIIKSPPRKTVS